MQKYHSCNERLLYCIINPDQDPISLKHLLAGDKMAPSGILNAGKGAPKLVYSILERSS